MAIRRTMGAPPITYTPKLELDMNLHTDVELHLKRLKMASRLVRDQLSLCRTEARILERLYYKSKNQHRSAVFWDRVSEVRRYTARLVDMGLVDVLDTLRVSFYGEAAQRKYVIIATVRTT
jgi:hypothetical protein